MLVNLVDINLRTNVSLMTEITLIRTKDIIQLHCILCIMIGDDDYSYGLSM